MVTEKLGKLEQSISVRERALCQLCVLSFRVEVKKEKDTKVVPCNWYSEVKYQVNCSGAKCGWKTYLNKIP